MVANIYDKTTLNTSLKQENESDMLNVKYKMIVMISWNFYDSQVFWDTSEFKVTITLAVLNCLLVVCYHFMDWNVLRRIVCNLPA